MSRPTYKTEGWQYPHKRYRQMLYDKGIRQSMSCKGNDLENAVNENFFGLLKCRFLYFRTFESMEHFNTALIDYPDYYNHRRREK